MTSEGVTCKYPSHDVTMNAGDREAEGDHQSGAIEAEGSAGYISCTVNLLKAVIGAGILAIPNAISTLGWVPGVAALIFASVLSSFGLFLLSIVGSWNGRRSTFGSVAEKNFPKASIIFDLTVVLKCLGVAIAYLGNICAQIPVIVKGIRMYQGTMTESDTLPLWMTNYKIIWVAIVLVLLTPIASLRKIDSLKYSSFFGMFSVFYLLVLSIHTFVKSAVNGANQPIRAFVPLNSKSLSSFAIFVFAFNCHQNLFPIQNEATCNTPQSMVRVIMSSTILTLLIYTTFGICSYGSFDTISDDILRTFPLGELQFIAARILFALLLACSYPLQTFPCRAAIERIVSAKFPAFAKRQPGAIYWGVTASIILLTGAVASLNIGFGIVLKIIGSTAGPVICFFFPAALYLKETSSDVGGKRGRSWIRNAAKALLLVSFATTIMSIVLVIMEIVDSYRK